MSIGLSLSLAIGLCVVLPGWPTAAQEAPAVETEALPAEAAQPTEEDPCTPEAEPNDAPELAPSLTDPICVSGTLPDGDQDLFLWEVVASEASTPWTFHLEGVRGTLTALQVLPVTSEPGVVPPAVGGAILSVSSDPLAGGPVTEPSVLLPPGRYVLGISRSPLPDGSSPTSIDYRLGIEPGTVLAPDEEPNDDAATAVRVAGGFTISGDAGGSSDVYVWRLSEEEAGRAWQLDVQGQVGASNHLVLADEAGVPLATVSSDPLGRGHLYDLRLAAGDYVLSMSDQGDGIHPYLIATSASEPGSADAEPNDDVAHAVPLDSANGVGRGRLAQASDVDDFRFMVDAELAAVQVDITLLSRGRTWRQLCLMDADDVSLQCRSGPGGAVLRGLLLPQGEHYLEVSGESSPGEPYLLRIDRTRPPIPDFETEPNDTPSTATTIGVGVTIRGHQSDVDPDVFAFTVTGAPQLWQVDATGDAISQLRWIQADGTDLAVADVAADRHSARLTDMYLIPGDHRLRIEGDGDYTLALTPLGPPIPGSEREPNDSSQAAEPLLVGATRSGRLPGAADIDVFRLSLAAPEHLRFELAPPHDGAAAFSLITGNVTLADARTPEVGALLSYDAQLPAGDYEVWLRGGTASPDRYELTVSREDPFAWAPDQEPDDGPTEARPLALGQAVEGSAWTAYDEDWYRLDPLPAGAQLRIEAASLEPGGGVGSVQLSDGTTTLDLLQEVEGEDPAYRAEAPPAGVPLYVRVVGTGDYRLLVRDPSTAAMAVDATVQPLPAELSMSLDSSTVAAHWPAGQRLPGTVAIRDLGGAGLDVVLDTATSHFLWDVDLEQDRVSVPAAGSVEVPLTVLAQPDVWADVPVRITVRARDGQGATTTGSVELTPSRDALPGDPVQVWSVPGELLGGLDVASLALGGSPVAALDPVLQASLHDGLTPSGGGFWAPFTRGQPLSLTVDLAGEEPVPIAGTILNPQARLTPFDGVPRDFALLLSEDGVDFEVALEGELSPLAVDQAFVLPTPIPARYAQLRVDTVHGRSPATALVLGEWKVVAVPEHAPSGGPLNIADPVRGGHVVWMDPQTEDITFPDTLIDEDPTRQTLWAEPGTRISWSIGFQHDRVARIEVLQWVDPPGSDPAMRFDEVDVAISTDSALGPWRDVGTWHLRRAADGSVADLVFDEPVWARYVRLAGKAVPKDGYAAEEPATLRVLETPTGESYRSVVGEWGQVGKEGPYEWLQAPDLSVTADPADDDDTPQTARALAPGSRASGRVQAAEGDVDWYAFSVPADQNSVRFTVGGRPSVGVKLALEDEGGASVPMTFVQGDEPGSVTYTAAVTGGARYRARVEQPPFSAVMTFDTSGSMGNYLSFVMQALRSYADGVTKGRESIQVVPFEEPPLLADWSDDAYALGNAVASYVPLSGSSSAEAALLNAITLLTGHEGARAILLVTDAETTSYAKSAELWKALAAVRPVIFSVHVGGDSQPRQTRHFMQDWADAAGGFYQYARSHGEIDRAFDRMATWLRRPASYWLSYETSVERVPPPEPGLLSVVSWPNPDGTPSQPTVGKGVAVETILDTSGSMLTPLGGKRRIEVAKDAFEGLLGDVLPEGVPMALRIFGDRSEPCGTRLAVPFGPLDPRTVSELVAGIGVVQEADTPIGDALLRTPDDLRGSSGSRIVLLITDSEETWPHRDLCGRDPADAIRKIRRAGITSVSIIGLAVKDRKATQTMRKWARAGNGTYFAARDLGQLARAVRSAMSAPFAVHDASGALVAEGVVNAAPVSLPPGSYRVVVSSDPEVTFDAIAVESQRTVTVTMPSAEEPPEPAPSASPTPAAAAPPGDDPA